MITNILMFLIIFISILAILIATNWYENEKNKLTEEQYEILDELIKVEEEKRKYL